MCCVLVSYFFNEPKSRLKILKTTGHGRHSFGFYDNHFIVKVHTDFGICKDDAKFFHVKNIPSLREFVNPE